MVAWHFGWARQLGPPLLWHVYAPAAALRWAWWWWGDPAWRGEFLSALTDVAVVAVVPVGIVRLLELQGRLPVDLGDAAAGLGSPRDLLATGQVAAHGDGVVLGAAGRRLLRDVGEGHVLAVGPPRSGKTAGIAIPTLLTYRGSALVYDPKGEMAVVAGRFRAALGPVFVLDPTSRDTARFNPLLEIREGDNLVADCQVAAEVLARSGAAGGDNPFWNDSASHLLTALLVHVRTSARADAGPPVAARRGARRRAVPEGRPPARRAPPGRAQGHGREAARQHQPDGLGRPAGAGGPDAAAPDRRERLPRLRPAGGRGARLGLPHGPAVARRPAPAVHAPARAEPGVRAARGGRPHRRRPGEAARGAPRCWTSSRSWARST